MRKTEEEGQLRSSASASSEAQLTDMLERSRQSLDEVLQLVTQSVPERGSLEDLSFVDAERRVNEVENRSARAERRATSSELTK